MSLSSNLVSILSTPTPNHGAHIRLEEILSSRSSRNSVWPFEKLEDDLLEALGNFDLKVNINWANEIKLSRLVR
jgi:hypothetical protein